MRITYNLPHVFFPGSSPLENAYVLRASLDYMIAINLGYLQYHPATPNLYESGVVYGRTRTWEPIPALYARKVGDCKSLASALIAQYRSRGKYAEPVFRWITRPDGNRDYHILVEVGPGKFEDPSKILGMGRNENSRFYHDAGE